ncbi:MAG TPA: PD-(D/E)XK nuclease family protein, partial [Thermodesulfobacteriota bacterium]|nr:PD-(D/E)XK nuclease family protein [Thermodesulfobacteriota bacterium]
MGAPQPASPLRHGLAAVPVHLIAEQLYCERKVDLALAFPDLERATPELAAGAAGHEALAAEAEPIAAEELAAWLDAGWAVRLHEYRFRGSVGDVPVVGRPDAVFLDGRRARLVLEFKFSTWQRPFPSHRLQLLAYGYLLAQNGYDVSELVCGVLMLPPAVQPGFVLPPEDYASCAAAAAALAAARRAG